MTIKNLEELSPSAFEHICYDIIRDLNFSNPQWRTPGADGGRDIEATTQIVDPTFASITQKWFIECKRYSSSIDWPTVYEKQAHAEALGADYLFIMTSSSASPTCLDRIQNWNSNDKKPKIRIWGKHEIDFHLSTRQHLRTKHNLDINSSTLPGIKDVALEVTKAVSTVYACYQSQQNFSTVLQYTNYLAQCWQLRDEQIARYQKFIKFENNIDLPELSSIRLESCSRNLANQGELLTLTWLAFISMEDDLSAEFHTEYMDVKSRKFDTELLLTPSAKTVFFLADVEVKKIDQQTFRVTIQ